MICQTVFDVDDQWYLNHAMAMWNDRLHWSPYWSSLPVTVKWLNAHQNIFFCCKSMPDDFLAEERHVLPTYFENYCYEIIL